MDTDKNTIIINAIKAFLGARAKYYLRGIDALSTNCSGDEFEWNAERDGTG